MSGGSPVAGLPTDGPIAAAGSEPLTHELAAIALLRGAERVRSDPVAAGYAVARALAERPDDLAVRLAAYRFCFYSHRFAEALAHADVIIRLVALRLNIASDWTTVKEADADFAVPHEQPGLFLQALIARGYCAARIGRVSEGRCALVKAVALDPRDRFGARRLLAVIDAENEPEDP